MAKTYDVIVIGTGPAGLTAATYCARAGLKVLALREKEGSNLERVEFIGNYFGFPDGVTGKKLLRLGERHARKYGAEIKKEEVIKCQDCELMPAQKKHALKKKFPKAKYLVHTQVGDYGCGVIVLAAGIQIKSAGIENEFKFLGKGVAVCVACDGPFYKKKKVVVVGSGNLAANEALELLAYTKDVTINTNGRRVAIDQKWLRKLKVAKIPVVNMRIAKLDGGSWVKDIEYMDGSEEQIEGLFLATGTASAIDFAKSLGLAMTGQSLEVDERGRTSVLGIWAAGDVTGPPRQIGKSVGQGVRAAIDLIEHARGGTYVDHQEK